MNECKACGRPMLGVNQVFCDTKCWELGQEPPLLTPAERQSLEALREARALCERQQQTIDHLRSSLASERQMVQRLLDGGSVYGY